MIITGHRGQQNIETPKCLQTFLGNTTTRGTHQYIKQRPSPESNHTALVFTIYTDQFLYLLRYPDSFLEMWVQL